MRRQRIRQASWLAASLIATMSGLFTAAPETQAAINNNDSVVVSVGGGAWTNGNITTQFSGTADNISIGGNTISNGYALTNGSTTVPQIPAIEVANSNAMNGYGPGDYIFTQSSVISGNGANTVWIQQKMLSYGFSIQDTTQNQSYPGTSGYWAGSDIYAISGYYSDPNPYSNPYWYAPGQYVHLEPYYRPSVSITGVFNSSSLKPGDTVTVTDMNNASSDDTSGKPDNAPASWAGGNGLIAIWYFNGTYTNAFASSGNLSNIPCYGFTPWSGTYQTGHTAATSFSLTVPSTASGAGKLFLYYVDGIDRYAEASYAVQVIAPTINVSVNPKVVHINDESNMTVTASNVPAGDTIVISQSGLSNGTLNGNYMNNQLTLTYPEASGGNVTISPFLQSNVAGTVNYAAQIQSPDGTVVASSRTTSGLVSVQWTTPTVTLSITPTTSQTTGQPFQVTGSLANILPTDTVTIKEVSATYPGTFGGSTNQQWYGPTSSSVTATVTSSQAQTVTYEAFIVDGLSSSGQTFGPSNQLSATWTVPAIPTLTLSASPTSTTVGSNAVLTVKATNMAKGDTITITQGAAYQGTLNGNYMNNQWSLTYPEANGGSATIQPFVQDSYPETVTYTATLTDPQGTLTKTVSVTWTPLRAPTLTLTASPTSTTIGSNATLTVSATQMAKGDTITISQGAAYQGTLNGNYMNNQWSLSYSEPNGGSTTIQPFVQDSYAETVTYTATLTDPLGKITKTVSVTWTPIQAPTLTLSVDNTNPVVGQSVTLTATSTSIPSGSAIFVHDLSADNTINGSNVPSPGSPTSPDAVQATDNQAQTVKYWAAEEINGKYYDTNTVTVTWSPTGVTITLAPPTQTVPDGTPASLTATVTNAPAGSFIVVSEDSGDHTFQTSNQSAAITANGGNVDFTVSVESPTDLTDHYVATLYAGGSTTAIATSTTVIVTWGSGSSGGSTTTTTCLPPPAAPPQPAQQVDSQSWSCNVDGSQTLYWSDSNWVLLTTQSTDANGCPVVNYQWVDYPVSYQHQYPYTMGAMQITGLFYDPGTPSNLWSPTNRAGSQKNGDAYSDNSTAWGGPALPTFGNPYAYPSVYVRVGGGFAFHLLWTGSPNDMPSTGSASFTVTNPDGSTQTWTKPFTLLPATVYNVGTSIDPNAGANGNPPAASEWAYSYTNVPKYTTSNGLELVKWNLTGDPTSTAHIGATVQVTTGCGSVTWTDSNLAQTLGVPTWYMIHSIPVHDAPYLQPKATAQNNFTYQAP